MKSRNRFNRFSVGRTAVLYRRGKTRAHVLDHLFRTYGKKWGFNDPSEMYRFLFQKGRGMRPNIVKLFEGKTPDEVKIAYHEWLQKMQQFSRTQSEKITRLNQNPDFREKVKANALKARAKLKTLIDTDPGFKKKQQASLAKATAKYVELLHTDPEFRNRIRSNARINLAKARAALKQIVERDPDFERMVKEKLRANIEKAKLELKRLRETDPEFEKRYKKMLQNKAAKARTDLRRLLESDPEFRRKQKIRHQADIKVAQSVYVKSFETNPSFRRKIRKNIAVALEEYLRLFDTNPDFRKRISDIRRAYWSDPEWRANQTELIRIAVQHHWSLIRSGLLEEFRGRGIILSFDPRKRERVVAIKGEPLSMAIENERKQKVQEAILNLDSDEALAITTTFFEGLDYPTTAVKMGITVEELDTTLNQAYQKLARELKGV